MNHEVLERIAAPSYLDNLTTISIHALRALRAECQREENVLSYQRRLAQGRQDILRAEAERRAAGRPAPTSQAASDVVSDLTHALAGQVTGGKADRLPRGLSVDDEPEFVAELDRVCPPSTLVEMATWSDEALARALGELSSIERTVSGWRQLLFRRLDVLSGELTRRYREGEADVDSLLR